MERRRLSPSSTFDSCHQFQWIRVILLLLLRQMLAPFRSGTGLQTRINPLSSILGFNAVVLSDFSTHFRRTLTINLEMGTSSKRPICPSCSKPTRICLCNRFKTPILDNCVAVTILQHSLEKNHPLNSTRIATLGLKNLNVEWVSDVNFEAQFEIHMLKPNLEADSITSSEKIDGFGKSSHLLLEMENGASSECLRTKNSISFTVGKYGAISSFNHQMVSFTGKQKVCFDHLLDPDFPVDMFKKGFVVRKLQKRQVSNGMGYEESEEFDMEVPPGSVLLFPSEKAVGPEEIDFKVKNVIVLDGTWAKATRMYNENPWLKTLPHLRLDLDKLSLYGEVRNQPKAGYLSTIESIVYALKAVGENLKGLDGLLDVFASMVGDQRRSKDERLSKETETLR